MSREQLCVSIAAVLTTALETEPSPFPESYAYMALGSDMAAWGRVRGALVGGGFVTIRGCSIALTEKGRALAEQCKAAAVAV